jgi:uncharacterized membrane protein YqgA involved in biofilm formation
MILQGTIVNTAAIIAGCAIGHFAGRYITPPLRRTMMAGLGLAVLLVGVQLALQSEHIMIIIASLLIGGIIGELAGIERRLQEFGERLQERFSSHGSIAEGFVTASLLYCVGAMAIMGALQDGVGDPPTILYAKAALDGIASIALTVTLGPGVVLSIIPLIIYQGGLTLIAGSAAAIMTEPAITEMNGIGGLLIVAIGLDLLDIKRLPIGNLLPAVFIALLLVHLTL